MLSLTAGIFMPTRVKKIHYNMAALAVTKKRPSHDVMNTFSFTECKIARKKPNN